ncbi:MAG TPA: SGNH/GDSL hydrolase family protein [Vicinamibacteria bacterium]|nr:SGNH/GDSL hydrolase family protein [Vicinamibacteria bacterium]
MATPRSTSAKSLLLALASTLLTLGVLEAGFRARAYRQDARRQEAALKRPSRLKPGDPARLGDLVRASRSDDIVYELRPGLHVSFMGRAVSTNAEGFRDRDYAAEKPPGVARIVGLGDSVMFGWGVADGEDYLAVLEAKLEAESLGARFEVLNTAVPGYNGVMELATLKEKGLRFRPDLVIVGFCGNDMGLPNFLQERNDYLSARRSFLADFVRERLSAGPTEGDDEGGLVGRPVKVRWRSAQDEDGSMVPPRYAHMIGVAAYDRTLKELRRLAEVERFELLVLYYPAAPHEVRRLVESNGIASFSAAPAVRRFMVRHGGVELGRELLHLSRSDPHPSAAGHRVIADALFEHLHASGMLARLAERALTRP